MEEIRQHFDGEALSFDANIVRLIPYYDSMIDALVSSLPFTPDDAFSVLDLGCGTGTVSERILQSFPRAHVTCLDIAENMLSMAKSKLGAFVDEGGIPRADYAHADFATWTGSRSFDAIVSSLALHHLPDDDSKRALFRKAFALLSPGGVFRNADIVLSADSALQALNMRKWREYMLRSVSPQEIDEKWMVSHAAEDRPAVLADQLDWLMYGGFVNVDVIWKYYNFAVYGGKKA
jgi:tRNA (cmo5U34)-methyltransferase